MADSSIFDIWNKLQDKFSSPATSSNPCEVPSLTKLNDMVYEVFTPPEERRELDIVFFHGLQFRNSKDAHVKTWMSRDNSQLWIQTWLVELFPKARILTVTYDSSAEKSQESGNVDMYCTAENLVASLIADEVRVGKAGTPVVFVGHCLGGHVLKELCLSAAWMGSVKSEQGPGMERIRDLLSNLQGMFYYGTPHVGSLLGDKLHKGFKGALLEEMETLKASSARRNQNFEDLRSKYGWITSGMGESRKTYVEFLETDIHIVTEASSRHSIDSYYSANADHYDICKAEGKNSSALQQLGNFIRTILKSPRVLQGGLIGDAENKEFFVDFKGRAKEVRSMLNRADVNTIFIVGLSGLGKTSLARQVYQSIGHNFDAKCFVSLDSMEGQSNGSEQVWGKIHEGLEGVHFGWNQNLPNMLYQPKSKKVLMVLDNVESQSQIDVLRIGAWLEGSSSKLIITSTTDRLDRIGTPSNTFRVGFLSREESLQLFCHYAFQSREEPHALRDIVKEVMTKCDGYPLFVKILAGFVSKESDVHEKQLWVDLLKKLEKAEDVDSSPDYRPWAKLKMCYNTLLPSEQEIFLDILVIFNGFPLSSVKRIWKVSREFPHTAWSNLKSRFLVSGSGDRIQMHAQLRNLGQNIASRQNASLEKWRRISGHYLSKELEDKLVSKNTGIMETLALKLNLVENDVFKLKKAVFRNYDHLQYLIFEGGRASTVTFWGKVKLPRSLVYFRWKDGSFIICPLDFTGLDKLIVLELVDCKSLRSLSPSIAKARSLTWLELEGCSSLQELPQGLSKDLQYLGLRRTGLRKLPNDFQNFKKLVDLKASETKLTRVPQGLGGLEMLTYLNLRETGVTTLPDSVGDLKRLECLDLSETMLTSLPESIGQLRELQKLDLSWTMLSSLPGSIGLLKCLTSLKLGESKLRSVPESLGQLGELQMLDLSGTMLSSLPGSIGLLKGLKKLTLEGSKLRSVPESIGQLGELQELDLSRTMLSSLPGSIGLLKGLKKLTLEGSKLRSVPESIGQLGDLQELDLSRTMLRSVPESIGQLGELQKLDLSRTMLSSLPDNIGLLKRLRRLFLRGSKLRSFPESLRLSFGDLAKLEEMDLHNTPLETLPDSIGKLSELSSLHLSGTNLSTLPETVGDLSVLQSLELPYSRLQSVPRRMRTLPLQSLRMDIGKLFKSLESKQARSEGEDRATIGWPSESAIHAFLHQVLPSQAMEHLSLSGRGYPQSGVLPLFLALHKMPSLCTLELHDFNLVETIPCELGELTRLKDLDIRRCEILRELPESLGMRSKLFALVLVDTPSLRRLPESFSARHSLCVMNCGSLQQTTSEGESSTSSDSSEPTSPCEPHPHLLVLQSDSLGLVEHFLELPRGNLWPSITCYVECEEFEKARKMAKYLGSWYYVLPTKTVRDLFGVHLNISGVGDFVIMRCKSDCKIHDRGIEVTRSN